MVLVGKEFQSENTRPGIDFPVTAHIELRQGEKLIMTGYVFLRCAMLLVLFLASVLGLAYVCLNPAVLDPGHPNVTKPPELNKTLDAAAREANWLDSDRTGCDDKLFPHL